eukprot:gene10825-11977_t
MISQSFIILLLVTLLPSCRSLANRQQSMTYDGTSYTKYENRDTRDFTSIRFAFKTYQENSFLLSAKDEKSRAVAHIKLTIQNGRLHVEISDGVKQASHINLASGLNDIQWHTVVVAISSNNIHISVDNTKASVIMDKYLELPALLHFGGIGRRFVGCIGSVMYLGSNGEEARPDLVKKNNVMEGCSNACHTNPCKNNGRCLNLFFSTSCDCIGTGFEGPLCTKAMTNLRQNNSHNTARDVTPERVMLAANVVFLPERDYIIVKEGSRSEQSEKFTLTLRFRTTNARGLLLFAAHQTKAKTFSVAVHNGKLNIAMNKLEFTIGNGMLNDAKWHLLTVIVSKGMVNAEIDAKYRASYRIPDEKNLVLFPLYVGGIPKDMLLGKSFVSTNFVGCIQQLHINNFDVIYRALYINDKFVNVSSELSSQCPINTKQTKAETPTRVSKKKKQPPNGSKGKNHRIHPKIIESNNKDMIAWVTSGINETIPDWAPPWLGHSFARKTTGYLFVSKATFASCYFMNR